MTSLRGATTEKIDYIQRRSPPLLEDSAQLLGGPLDVRRILRVRSVGWLDRSTDRVQSKDGWRPRTAELLTGLYGYRVPVAFQILGKPDGVSVQIGVWSSRGASIPMQDRRMDVLRAVLGGLYTAVRVEEVKEVRRRWTSGGVALGVPAPIGIHDADGSAPIDRVIAALAGTDWSVLVLAYPVAESAIARAREQVLDELRLVQTAAAGEGAPSPLAEQYVGLLKLELLSLGEGLATGSWRTGVYLLGDDKSYPRLASVWRSVYSGPQSLPEPVRIFDLDAADALAAAWVLPDRPGAPGPGHYQRPFELQTLLTTANVSAYIHLPELETPGFAVEKIARFDTVAAADGAGGLLLGSILQSGRDAVGDYRVPLKSLNRHVFVAGVTGSGKTNSLLSLLTAVDSAGLPFLVIEPAKTEYRALLSHPILGKRIRVFTAGEANVSPLLINPFEVPAGTTVSEHLDLVRSAFSVAFGMWTPLPQILERCLHGIYADRGWNLRTNDNPRLHEDDDPVLAYPTLTDLIVKVNEIVGTLGYDERVAGDLRTALITRLESLRGGGKGAMLDVARSLSDEELFRHPTVIELEALGDDADKSFISALLLIRLAEYRRGQGQQSELVHVLVVEEAHRLLSEIGGKAPEEAADPRRLAVETFSNLLAEVRAYGQGVIVVDQVPSRLTSGVLKNTDLKIVHRLVAEDDRMAMAGAMAMDAAQAGALTTLEVGVAAVFSSGDDSPMLIRIPLIRDRLSPTPPTDELVAAHMALWRAGAQNEILFLPRPFCVETCAGGIAICAVARQMTADVYVQQTMARVVLATVEEPDALDRLWTDAIGAVSARRPPGLGHDTLLRATLGHIADWYVHRRGAQGNWLYRDTVLLGDLLRSVFMDKIDGQDPHRTAEVRGKFRNAARRLSERSFSPYPVCDQVCNQDPPLCLYRSAVSDVVASGRYQESWRSADAVDAESTNSRRQQTWEVCQDAAYELVEFPEGDASDELRSELVATAKRVCLCFEQQMLADDHRKGQRTSRRILARVLGEAGLPVPSDGNFNISKAEVQHD